MFTQQTNISPQCDRHVGEAFPPRCSECDALAVDAAATKFATRLKTSYQPATECPRHPGYPLEPTCAKCERDAAFDRLNVAEGVTYQASIPLADAPRERA